MPNYDDKPGGLLFLEATPKTERHPFLTGTVRLPDGSECKLSAWWVTDRETGEKRKTSTGNYMVSCTLEPLEATTTTPKPSAKDDDLPF